MRMSDWSSDVCSSDLIEQQRNRLQRHDDKGGERNRDDVGERAVSAHSVEVIETDRRERRLDDNAGQQQPCKQPKERRPPWLLAPHQPLAHPRNLVQSDNGGDGCEGELEARSEEHTSELQSLILISYAGFCLKKKNTNKIMHI